MNLVCYKHFEYRENTTANAAVKPTCRVLTDVDVILDIWADIFEYEMNFYA